MKQQPDLNWRNPAVKQAMWDAVRFWLDLGVDGFRLDAIGTIFEDPDLTPHTVPMTLAELRRFSETAATPEEKALEQKYWREMFQNQLGGPGLHDLMKELRAVLDEYPGDRMLVGEDDDIAYLGNGADELHLVFNFPLMRTERITPAHIRANQAERLAQLDALPARGWGCNTLGNHDTSRIFTRYATSPSDAPALARLNAALVLTLRGTPFLYNGEEIGMTDLIITDPGRLRDTMATWYYEAARQRPEDRSGRSGRARGRDEPRQKPHPHAVDRPTQCRLLPCRRGTLAAGRIQTMPRASTFATSRMIPGSLLNFYRRLIAVRRQVPALVAGEYRPLHEAADGYVAFLRTTETQTVLVLLNYSNARHDLRFDVPGKQGGTCPLLLGRE